MKVLTLSQPYATLMAWELKRFDTRSWGTKHRGPLAIHAAQSFPRDYRNLCVEPHFCNALARCGYLSWRELPLGEILSWGILRNIWPTSGEFTPSYLERWVSPELAALLEKEMAFGDYREGRQFWHVSDMQRLAVPIPAKGALGLWDCNDPRLVEAQAYKLPVAPYVSSLSAEEVALLTDAQKGERKS